MRAHFIQVRYLYQSVSKEKLVALYRACDVMLVTPLRDGMNLVAKEFVASRTDLGGALVLSEFAGAAEAAGPADGSAADRPRPRLPHRAFAIVDGEPLPRCLVRRRGGGARRCRTAASLLCAQARRRSSAMPSTATRKGLPRLHESTQECP